MTQEDKELLLKDLCNRLPYGVKVKYAIPTLLISVIKDRNGIKVITEGTLGEHSYNIEDIKPYLRPMSDMTEEERIDSLEFAWHDDYGRLASYNENIPKYIDWLNAHHFDYRGLIPMGLAIAVTEENNPYKE